MTFDKELHFAEFLCCTMTVIGRRKESLEDPSDGEFNHEAYPQGLGVQIPHDRSEHRREHLAGQAIPPKHCSVISVHLQYRQSERTRRGRAALRECATRPFLRE